MNSPVIIELYGEPVAKGRAKFARIGRGEGSFVTTYTPGKTRKYEDQLRYAAQVVMAGRPLITGAIALNITAFVPIPQSWSKKKKAAALAGEIFPEVKPDWDNYGKIVSDALNCVVFTDDKLVCDGRVLKLYSDRPRLIVEVTSLQAIAA
jgi:Holliday junction resolvase RusA-like endonuclease